MISERGAGLLIGAAFAWLMGRFLGVPELYVLAATAVVLVGLGVLTVWLPAARVEVRRAVAPSRIPWGAGTRVTLELRNVGRLPAGVLLVTDEVPYLLTDGARFTVPGLPRGAAVTLAYDVRGAARGRYRVGPARVRLRDPFGLAERVRRVGEAGELVVYPRIERLGHAVPAAPRQGESGRHRRTLLHAGDEFSTIREWAPGDDVRMVHWPSSAHRARLMVRQFEQPWEPQTTLLCDTRSGVHRGLGPDSTVETAISATASVAELLAGYGHRLRLALPDDEQPAEPQDRGTILDRLAEAEPSRQAGLAPALRQLGGRGGGGLLVAVVGPAPVRTEGRLDADTQALLTAGRPYSVRIALVVDTARPGTLGQAADLAAILHHAGWRTAVLRPGAPMGEAWQRVAGAAALAAGGGR